jgi:hypothetical protein
MGMILVGFGAFGHCFGYPGKQAAILACMGIVLE